MLAKNETRRLAPANGVSRYGVLYLETTLFKLTAELKLPIKRLS